MKTILAIHGGAGTISRADMTPEKEKAYRQALEDALQAGWNVHKQQGSAVDMAEAAVVALENNPLFNAGKGAVFTHEGKHELDACITDGQNGNIGAVAGITRTENPVKAARLVLDHSDHVLLCGSGTDQFAREHGLNEVENAYFSTEFRRQQWLEALAAGEVFLDHHEKKFGTVGAVALDHQGNLAAATSTGGMTNKKFGRVGDTPIPGAGTYADNQTCAVSCTGHGEYFIRFSVAFDVACRMKYLGLPLDEAARQVVFEVLQPAGGEGGLIALDAQGHCTLPFNSAGMYRGFLLEDGSTHTAIF